MRMVTRLLASSFTAAIILGSSCSSVLCIGQAQATESDDTSTEHAQPVEPSDKATEQKEQPSSEEEAWAPGDVERLVQDAAEDLVPILQPPSLETLTKLMKPGECALKARDAKTDDERYHVRVCFVEVTFLNKYLMGSHGATDNSFLAMGVEIPMTKAVQIIPDEQEREWMINEAPPLVLQQLKGRLPISLPNEATAPTDSQ